MTPASRPARRLALAAGLLTAVLISCGREITGPVTTPVNAFKRFASLAFAPQYTTALTSSALRAALTQVAFEKVHITLRREDGSIALDTTVNFPAGADSLTLSLVVQLAANAPASGVPFSLNLGYVNAAGDTVFKGGPFSVTVKPSTTGSAPPPPLQIPVHYTGTGANATSVAISPKILNGTAGQPASFSAVARASDGSTIAGTPIVFTSSDAGVITINSTSGAATLVGRGTAKVYAQLLTGPSDSATVAVILPASRIEIASGAAQSAPAGSTLPQPIVARVLAADGIGVAGVTVNFAVTAGGGSVTPATAVSAADGSVSTSWKLGGTAGSQAMTVTSTGLSGSPLSVSANALPVVASRLLITTGPLGGKVGAPIGAVVTAQDAFGNTAISFAGDVTVAIGTNPGTATLGGTVTVKAVNGVATFSGLTLNRPGTGYTLTFSSTSLASATSAAFNSLTGDAAKLVFAQMPAAADVGIAIAPPVQVFVQDSAGNAVTTFTGAVTVAIGANTGGGTLTGTQTRNAVAGVATFNDLSINKKGSSYTLVASATGLASGTSAAFNMAPGAPTGISVVSGGGQTAAAGTALRPIVLLLHDALGNGISGATISLAVSTGGGSLGATSLVTDSDGRVTAVWTLGGAGGVQTITASITGVPAITVTATAIATTGIAYSLVNFGNWTDSTRWSPVGIPGANDDVTIGGDNSVTLMGNTVVHSLTFSLGSVSMGAYDLTVLGNVTGTEAYYSGTGALRIAGAGSHVLNILSVPTLAVDAGAIVAQGGHVTATGDVIVAGMLVPNGHRLNVQGLLNVLPGGGLKMTQALDTVFTWDASFAGVASDTLLTAGYLSVGDNFTQAGVAKSFAPTGTHVTVLTANAINLALRTDRASASTSGRPAGRAAAETAVPAGRRRNFLTYNQISFANPGYTASHFNLLRFSQLHDLDFATNVYATRADAVGDTLNTHYVRGAGGKLFMKNGNLVNLIFNGPVLQVDAANSLTRLDSLTFIAPATADQLTLNMAGGGTPTLTKLSFSTGPSTGRYLVVNGAGTATMVKTMPGSHGGFVGTSGGGAISGWIASRNMTATSTGNWTTPGTWSPAGLPSRYDTVTIATGASVTLDAGGRVRDMVIAAGGSFNTPSYTSLDVYGNWTADTTSTVTGGVSAAYTNFYGNAQVRGRLWGASVNKAMTLVGRTIFDGYVSVGDYAYTPITFDVNGQVATINGGFSTFYGGRLKMTSPTGDLSVCCNLFFTGGSTDGLLTDGILRVTGNFTGSGAAFSATGNHKTIVSSPGGFGNSISFDTPGSTSLTGHFGILQLSDTVHSTTLSSDVYAVTKLATLGTGSPVTLVGAATTLHAPTAVSTNPLVFSRVRLHLYNASASTVLSNATFQNFTSTAFETQLTVEGAGTIAMSSLLFSTSVANTYNYLFANNLGAGLTLNLTSMSPILSATAGKIAVSGTPLAVVNWSP